MSIDFGTYQSANWLQWLRSYELSDPEPKLNLVSANYFRAQYRTQEVLAHAEWHRRMTEAWQKEKRSLQKI